MPSGILLVDLKSKEIVLANREMEIIVSSGLNATKIFTLKEKICRFFMQKVVS